MNDLPIYVMVSYHASIRGALPLKGIVKRLGGMLKVSTTNKDTHTHVFFFDQSIYGRTLIKLIEKEDVGMIATALNETNY